MLTFRFHREVCTFYRVSLSSRQAPARAHATLPPTRFPSSLTRRWISFLCHQHLSTPKNLPFCLPTVGDAAPGTCPLCWCWGILEGNLAMPDS